MILSMSSLLVSGNMFDTRLLVYVMDNSRCLPQTFATMDLWTVWALTELQLGEFLDVDAFGQPHAPHAEGKRCGKIAGGYRGIVCYHKGDEKYIQRAYRTSHNAVSKQCCWTCMATTETGPMLYTHHGPRAEHRKTLLSTEEFIRKVNGVVTWVSLPGWAPSILTYDWLHIVDLCIVPECSASALIELTKEGVFGLASTGDERLRMAFVSFIKACKKCKVRSRGQIFSLTLGGIQLVKPFWKHIFGGFGLFARM